MSLQWDRYQTHSLLLTAYKYFRTIIQRVEEFEGEANEKVELMDKEVDEAVEEIMNPKKKKK